ncbi:hypothetical protein [Streptomyces atriruber]|uniref:hypothetical protein n=1 Tax=Streptomyces atriruber TaxID=545121 RepID=UPI0012FEB780|nr:hypothetical protein [Streptomyces atriruber]
MLQRPVSGVASMALVKSNSPSENSTPRKSTALPETTTGCVGAACPERTAKPPGKRACSEPDAS